jgi:hypothetical protein
VGAAGTTGAAGAGTAGTGGAPIGTAGTTGNGGSTGTAGSVAPAGTAGSGGGGGTIAGTAGTTGAGGGAAGAGGSSKGGATGTGGASGATGTGGRGGTTGTAGSGTAGATGAAGTTGAAGRGGTTGTAGASGSGGRAGTTGTAGASGGGGTAASGGMGGRGPDRIQVVAQCQSTNGAQDIRVTFKILNPDSVAKQWSDIKVRYYYTPTVQSPAMVKFDFVKNFSNGAQLTTSATATYVEVGFMTGSGMIAGFDNVTGSDEIQLHLYNYSSPTWNSSQMDDYSYSSCAGVSNTGAYTDRLTMPGYYQGNLAWGSEPPL